MSKINVYKNDPNDNFYNDNPIVARVNYNERLDYWDGSNWTNGGLGMHKGITKLRKPADPEKPYVIIIGSQWQGSPDYGYIVSSEAAVQEILKFGDQEESWVWPELKKIIDEITD